ncbi:MAG: Rap1a/Tai family immunity protein [Gammaproteobacteria bacterium]
MQLKRLSCLTLLTLLFAGPANAIVTEDDFVALKTQNIINLCTASPQDIHYREAIHFCQGYLVGAFHYYAAESANKPELQMVCYPNPRPSRNVAVGMFVAWAKKHPEFMNELPVETEFRFLTETWPCKKS